MRLTVVALALSLLAVTLAPALPTASACRISVSEPTKPAWSRDCVPDVEMEVVQTVALSDLAVGNTTQSSGVCGLAPCGELLTVSLDVSAGGTNASGPLEVAFEAWTADGDQRIGLASASLLD